MLELPSLNRPLSELQVGFDELAGREHLHGPMGMRAIVVFEPRIQLIDNGQGIQLGIATDVISFERLNERLGDAV